MVYNVVAIAIWLQNLDSILSRCPEIRILSSTKASLSIKWGHRVTTELAIMKRHL